MSDHKRRLERLGVVWQRLSLPTATPGVVWERLAEAERAELARLGAKVDRRADGTWDLSGTSADERERLDNLLVMGLGERPATRGPIDPRW